MAVSKVYIDGHVYSLLWKNECNCNLFILDEVEEHMLDRISLLDSNHQACLFYQSVKAYNMELDDVDILGKHGVKCSEQSILLVYESLIKFLHLVNDTMVTQFGDEAGTLNVGTIIPLDPFPADSIGSLPEIKPSLGIVVEKDDQIELFNQPEDVGCDAGTVAVQFPSADSPVEPDNLRVYAPMRRQSNVPSKKTPLVAETSSFLQELLVQSSSCKSQVVNTTVTVITSEQCMCEILVKEVSSSNELSQTSESFVMESHSRSQEDELTRVQDMDISSRKSAPTAAPTVNDTQVPTVNDTRVPTVNDTRVPTVTDTQVPTVNDTRVPTLNDTQVPTLNDTRVPTLNDTQVPTVNDTRVPTVNDTRVPTVNDTRVPTVNDTRVPTVNDTRVPTVTDTRVPTVNVAQEPQLDGTPIAAASKSREPTLCQTVGVACSQQIEPMQSIVETAVGSGGIVENEMTGNPERTGEATQESHLEDLKAVPKTPELDGSAGWITLTSKGMQIPYIWIDNEIKLPIAILKSGQLYKPGGNGMKSTRLSLSHIEVLNRTIGLRDIPPLFTRRHCVISLTRFILHSGLSFKFDEIDRFFPTASIHLVKRLHYSFHGLVSLGIIYIRLEAFMSFFSDVTRLSRLTDQCFGFALKQLHVPLYLITQREQALFLEHSKSMTFHSLSENFMVQWPLVSSPSFINDLKLFIEKL